MSLNWLEYSLFMDHEQGTELVKIEEDKSMLPSANVCHGGMR